MPGSEPVATGGRRRAALRIAAAVIAAAVILTIALIAGRTPAGQGRATAPTTGSAAPRAPAAPGLPVANGVRLTGFVVDGAGLPVPGA
ncbi:MAG TPA: hypothetical protein VGC42_25500, partial [Kofleriaceae bacterium]